jgi:hypothetical protein
MLRADKGKVTETCEEGSERIKVPFMAAELGVSIRGLAEDFGNLGRRSVEGAAGVAEGVGSVLKGLFGGTTR